MRLLPKLFMFLFLRPHLLLFLDLIQIQLRLLFRLPSAIILTLVQRMRTHCIRLHQP